MVAFKASRAFSSVDPLAMHPGISGLYAEKLFVKPLLVGCIIANSFIFTLSNSKARR
jgi:hypothetical protein